MSHRWEPSIRQLDLIRNLHILLYSFEAALTFEEDVIACLHFVSFNWIKLEACEVGFAAMSDLVSSAKAVVIHLHQCVRIWLIPKVTSQDQVIKLSQVVR